jgi:hypothetical protein
MGISTDLGNMLMAQKRDWYRELPTDPDELGKLASEAWIELPREYLQLFRISNGGEGGIAINPEKLSDFSDEGQ